MVDALTLLYRRDISSGKTAGRHTFDILPSLTATEKISLASLKWSFHSDLGKFSLRHARAVTAFMFSMWTSGQHVTVFTILVTGLSSAVTRLIIFLIVILQNKCLRWVWWTYINIYETVHPDVSGIPLSASTSLTGKNVIWWNYLRQLIFSGSSFWISF